MNSKDLIRIAYRSILKNKFRTFLTMLGIIIGVASVITMLAIGEGSKESIKDTISSLGSNMIIIHPGGDMRKAGVAMDRNSMRSLTLDDLASIKEDADDITAVSPVVQSSGQAIYRNNNSPTSVQGVGEDFLIIKNMEIDNGQFFTGTDVKKASKVAVIGKTVYDNLFPEGGDPLGRTIRFNRIPLKVIGVLKEKGQNTFGQDQDDIILSPYTTVQKRLLAISHINEIMASATSDDSVDDAITSIENILRNNHKIKQGEEDDFRIMSQKELLTSLGSTSEMMTVLLASIAGISLLVGGIGIMNIMFVSVIERTKEIGLRLSIGAKETDIMLQFLIESVIISLTGGIFGFLLGVSASCLVNYILNWPVLVTESSVIISLSVCSFTGIFFGWYPAFKASKFDPITALRYE